MAEIQQELNEEYQAIESVYLSTLTVPQEIVYFSKKYGVDPNLALAIACAESGYDPQAQNQHSTAGGVYQWLTGSFRYYATAYFGKVPDKYDATSNIKLAILVLRDHGTSDWLASKPIWSKGNNCH